MAFRKLFATFADKYLEDVWHELNRRIEEAFGAGGGFQAGFDLAGSSTQQTVVGIRGVQTPSGQDGAAGDHMHLEKLETPRTVISDAGSLWVGESGQRASGGGIGTPYLRRFDVTDPADPKLVSRIDLNRTVGTVEQVRDLAQDGSFVYAALWDAEHVAIVSKATNQVVGWAYAQNPYGQTTRVISVTTDGAGKIFAVVRQRDVGGQEYAVLRWDLAACLGQPPNTVAPEASLVMPNGVRGCTFGASFLYVTDGGFAGGVFRIDPTGAMAILGNQPAVNYGMDCLVAFGSLWVTDYSTGLQRLDPVTLAVQATIPIPNCSQLNAIGVGPDMAGVANQYIWVADQSALIASSVNPASNAVVSQVLLPAYCDSVASIGSDLFLAAYIGLTPNPTGIVRVAIDGSPFSISVLNPTTIVYGTGPYGQVFMGDGDYLIMLTTPGTHPYSGFDALGVEKATSLSAYGKGGWIAFAEPGVYELGYEFTFNAGVPANIGTELMLFPDDGQSRAGQALVTADDGRWYTLSATCLRTVQAGGVVYLGWSNDVDTSLTVRHATLWAHKIG